MKQSIINAWNHIKKNWKTTIIGLIIIVGLLIEVTRNGMSIQDAIFGMAAIGFITAKDSDQSHTLN